MAAPGAVDRRPAVWGRIRALSARTPLRIKLVAAILVLVASALAGAGFAAATKLNSQLTGRVYQELRGNASRGGASLCDQGDGDHELGPRGPAGYYGRHPPYNACLRSDGTQLPRRTFGDDVATPRVPRMTLEEAVRRAGRPFTVHASTGGGDWLMVVTPLPDRSRSSVLALSLADEQATVAQLVELEAVIGSVALLLVAGLGYLIVRRSLRPLVEVEETAAAIAAGDLSRRVPDRDPRTEVGRLSAAMNGMLHQIEGAFRQRQMSEEAAREAEVAARTSEADARTSEERMRRFVADASHELRTPLTSIRGFAELSRQRGTAADEEEARFLRRIEEEAARMGLLVDDLLLLARLDQQRPLERREVDLLALASDAVRDSHVVAPGRAIALRVDDGPDIPVVIGDEPRLRQVIGNLMTNALTHTDPGTPVSVRLGTVSGTDGQPGWAVLEVTDEGDGLGPDEARQVFERFWRADSSRTRASGGSGLGLSIVGALTAAHGGRVELDTAPGQGATFRVLLPLPQRTGVTNATVAAQAPTRR